MSGKSGSMLGAGSGVQPGFHGIEWLPRCKSDRWIWSKRVFILPVLLNEKSRHECAASMAMLHCC